MTSSAAAADLEAADEKIISNQIFTKTTEPFLKTPTGSVPLPKHLNTAVPAEAQNRPDLLPVKEVGSLFRPESLKH